MSAVSFSLAAARTQALLTLFHRECGGEPSCLCSAPGRTELGGNHTDHQGGRVLAAAVSADMLACARPNGSDVLRVFSVGYRPFTVLLSDRHKQRSGTSAALVQGMAQLLRERGFPVGGADICLQSDIPNGSGLSSSAAFEVLVGQVLNTLFCGSTLSPMVLAQTGQQAENQWFGKPCGLMDQIACAVGGVSAIDFGADTPRVEKLTLGDVGYELCIVEVGAGHQNLTAAYAAITKDMAAAAAFFGCNRLSQVGRDDFWASYGALRQQVGDRPALRAAHYFEEVRRVTGQQDALQRGDFTAFLSLVRESGRSSGLYLQNLYDTPIRQPMTAALAYGEHLLAGEGACRVHGGGFGGTMQAWVPQTQATSFAADMSRVIGPCHRLHIRDEGALTLR